MLEHIMVFQKAIFLHLTHINSQERRETFQEGILIKQRRKEENKKRKTKVKGIGFKALLRPWTRIQVIPKNLTYVIKFKTVFILF